MRDSFLQSRTCTSCGLMERRFLPKHIAAFECRRDWLNPCDCGSTSFDGSSVLPDVDEELLREWSSDASLIFSSEDEDSLLEAVPLALLLAVLAEPLALREKRHLAAI